MLAAQKGHLHCCEILLEHGCKINQTNRQGHSALMVATAKDKVDVVRFLLTKRASRKLQSEGGRTVLMIAAERNSLDTLLVLLEGQPSDASTGKEYISRMVKRDVDLQDKNGRTALHYTCQKDMPEATRRLMEAGANVQILDHLQESPVKVAQKFGCAKAIDVIEDMKQSNLAREAHERMQGHKDASMKVSVILRHKT